MSRGLGDVYKRQAIAITVLMFVADVSFMIALTDAIVEPIANSIWYFILDKWWASKSKNS